MTKLNKRAPINNDGLHHYVATGGKPKDYEGTKGLNNDTVPNIPSESSEEYSLGNLRDMGTN